MTSRSFLVVSILWVLAAPGCGAATTVEGDAGVDAASGADSGVDARTTADSGGTDAGADSGTDSGAGSDAGADSGSDAGVGDAGSDASAGHDSATDAGRRVPIYHRADDGQCTAAAPAGNCSFGGGPECAMDSNCAAGTNGRCIMSTHGAPICHCTYDTCAHDTDCPTSQTCACHGASLHGGSNECVAGNCRVDADCGTGGFCSPTIGGCGGLTGYYCHTAGDLCVDDADCTGGTLQACEFVAGTSRWECVARQFCP